MRNRSSWTRFSSLVFAVAWGAAWASGPAGAQSYICEFSGQLPQSILSPVSWGGANLPPANCSDGIRTRVYTPAAGGVFYELQPAGCDPTVQACTVRARVGMTTAGNSANNQSFDSIVKVYWFNAGGTTVGSCGNVGAPIGFDAFDAAMSVSFQCGGTPDPRAGVYRVETRHTRCSSSTNYWSDSTSYDLSQTNLEAIFCTYGYQDTQYFLNSSSGPWSGPLSWTYDRIGNRLTETRGATTDTYSYQANSGATGNTARLDVVNLGIGGSRDYTFDAGGFLDLVDLGANQVDFTFDAAGQLAQIARPVVGETLNLRYDGRAFLCDASDVVSGGYTRPTYSSEGVVMSWNRLPASGGTTEIHNVLYFAGLPVVLWTKVGTGAATRQYFVDDHVGTPVYAFSTAGAALWNGGLEPFGKDWQEGTANDMLGKGIFLRFPGQWDDELFTNATLGADAHYNVHRWYEKASARYSSSDPMDLRGSANLQLFGYAEARPLIISDPFGLCSCDDECRSGKWNYLGGTANFAFLGGLSFGRGEYACQGQPDIRQKVWSACGIVGIYVGGGAGIEQSTGALPSACGCNRRDLATRSIGLTGGWSAIGGNVARCRFGDETTPVATATVTASVKGGLAIQACKVLLR